MSRRQRAGGLDVDEDLRHERREWRVQRVAWWMAVVILILALAGLFGDGPLSWRQLAAPDERLQCEYQRFARLDSPSRLRIQVWPPPDATEWTLKIGDAYLRQMRLQAMTPQPLRVVAEPDGMRCVFAGNGSTGPFHVQLYLTPMVPGRVRGYLQSGTARLDLWQLVYP